jgi:PhnB protein
MPDTNQPSNYNTLQPYLIIKNCAAALDFYKSAFGATERLRMNRPDGSIAHAEIQIGDSCVMMADENPGIGAFSPQHYGGCPISLHFYDKDCERTFHRAIAAGAKEHQKPADQEYGDRRAGVVDPFGYTWWIATSKVAKSNQSAAAKD